MNYDVAASLQPYSAWILFLLQTFALLMLVAIIRAPDVQPETDLVEYGWRIEAAAWAIGATWMAWCMIDATSKSVLHWPEVLLIGGIAVARISSFVSRLFYYIEQPRKQLPPYHKDVRHG